MIEIEKPRLQRQSDYTTVFYPFKSEGVLEELWYQFPSKFEKYFYAERLDTPLVALIFLALKTGQDIKVNGVISGRLYYSFQHYLINALCLANSLFKHIKIYPGELDETNLNSELVAGTGLSCGVDSLATFYDHENESGSFGIKFFTFFNVGSHGDFGGDRARKIYFQRLKSVQKFADLYGMEVVSVDSNLSEILKINFQQTHSFRNISAVLLFQKLFKNYYYASAYRFDHFNLNKKDTSDSDFLYLNLLSTESTQLHSGVAHLTRIERTAMISHQSDTFSFLDVCTDLSEGKSKKNCTECDKCLRTALTLEMIGELENYKEVFDFCKYKNLRDKFIGKIVATRKSNDINLEIFELLQRLSFLRPIHYLKATDYKIEGQKKRIKKFIKKNLKRV